jgi:Phage tail tube protein, GTA-gp10
MANRHRGEIEAEIGGKTRTLVLTLGALAELEEAFGAEDLVALSERLATGRLKARDLARIIGAGLRGAGDTLSDEDGGAMTISGGLQTSVRIAADLIAATFGEADECRRFPGSKPLDSVSACCGFPPTSSGG